MYNSKPSILGLIMAIVCTASNVQAGETRNVSTIAELQQALAHTTDTAEIMLAPGNYGTLSIRGLEKHSGEPLVLRSANPAHPAHFSKMILRNVKNVTIDGVVFDYNYQPGDRSYMRPFQVLSSAGITIRNSLFDGDLWRGEGAASYGFPTAFGMVARRSTNLTLANNEIRGFFRGIVISHSQNVTVHGSDIHSIRMDGMNFAQVENVLIEKNHIHDFSRSLGSKDHADMIQFWTNKTEKPSRNIVIRDNLLNSGKGAYSQSIFMRNEEVDMDRSGEEMFYRNVTIENNIIINAHLHGITVGETDGLIIRNNTVVRNAKSEGKKKNPALWTPKILVSTASHDVLIVRNITSKITGEAGQADWLVEGNYLVQDHARNRAGFYGKVFDHSVLDDPTRPEAFQPKKGGPLDGKGLGARLPTF